MFPFSLFLAKGRGKRSKNFKDKPAPLIDSETGKNVKVKPEDIILEVLEHS